MPKKEVTKNEKKENKRFFKDFKAELKKVIWPTPKQLVNSTVAVIVIVLITAAVVFALDSVFKLANDFGVDRLKQVVESHSETTENTETNQESVNSETNTETQNTVDNTANEQTTNNTTNTTNSTNNETTTNTSTNNEVSTNTQNNQTTNNTAQ